MYDLNKLSSDFTKTLNKNIKHLYIGNDILIYQKYYDFKISHLSPAYHFNRLKTVIEDYFSKDLPYMLSKGVIDEHDMSYSTLKIQLELNAFLVAIKTALDRLVYFVSKINKSVSSSTTFGRITTEGKTKGMMSEVKFRKDSDKLMKLIFDNYNDWISKAVKPRDTVVHYENLLINFKIINNEFSPVFNKAEKNIRNFELNDLKSFVDKWLIFSIEFMNLFSEKLSDQTPENYK